MTVADAGFDESAVVSVKEVMSDFERLVFSDIMIHYFSKNYDAVYVDGTEPTRFPSIEDMTKAYWKDLLDNK